MAAKIYKPAKTAMQSGTARTRAWVLEYEPAAPRQVEPLMGWTSSSDMQSQIKLSFPTKEEAIAYAERKGIEATVFDAPPSHERRPKAYADNFAFKRKGNWTH